MLWALHGQVGDPSDWNFLREQLPDEVPLQTPSLWDMVQPYQVWAESFCEHVSTLDAAPILMGYSMGGRLALHALLARPKMWKAAVIISAHPGLVDRTARLSRWKMDDEWALKLRTIDWQTFLTIWNQQAIFDGSEPPGERVQLLKWRTSIIRSFDHWGLSRQEPLLPKLQRLTMPVLWMTGEKDVKYQELAKEAASACPHGQHLSVPKAGHRSPWEEPEAFTTALLGFLKDRTA